MFLFLANTDRKKAHQITLQLEELLALISKSESSLHLKLVQPLSTDPSNCQQTIRFTQNLISDLRTYKTQKDKIAIDATCLEQSSNTPETLPKIRDLLKSIHTLWNLTWQTANLFLEKCRRVLLVLQTTKTIEEVLTPLERKIENSWNLPKDSQSLRKQQHLFRDLKLNLEGLEPQVISLKAEAEDAIENSGNLVSFLGKLIGNSSKNNNDNFRQIFDKLQHSDGAIYTTKVQQVIDRWQTALDKIENRIQEINISIPEAEKKEAQKARFKNLNLSIDELFNQLFIIEDQAIPMMTAKTAKPTDKESFDTYLIETSLHQANRWMSDMKALRESIAYEQKQLQNVEKYQISSSDMNKLAHKFKNLVEHWSDFKDQLQMYIEKLESWKAFHEAANECQRLLITLEKGYQDITPKNNTKLSFSENFNNSNSSNIRQQRTIYTDLSTALDDNSSILTNLVSQKENCVGQINQLNSVLSKFVNTTNYSSISSHRNRQKSNSSNSSKSNSNNNSRSKSPNSNSKFFENFSGYQINFEPDLLYIKDSAEKLQIRWKELSRRLKDKIMDFDSKLPHLEKREAILEKCRLLESRLKGIHLRVQEIDADVLYKIKSSSSTSASNSSQTTGSGPQPISSLNHILSTNSRQIQCYLTELETLRHQSDDIASEILYLTKNAQSPEISTTDHLPTSFEEIQNLNLFSNSVQRDITSVSEKCQAYLLKLSNLVNLVKSIKEIEKILMPIEKVLNEEFQDFDVAKLSASQLKHQERLYIGLQQSLITYEQQYQTFTKLVEEMQNFAGIKMIQDNNFSFSVMESIESATRDSKNSNSDGESEDTRYFLEQSNNLNYRWNTVKSSIEIRLSDIQKQIPLAEQMEANRSKHRILNNRRDTLERKIEMLEKTLLERASSSVVSENAAIEIIIRSLQSITTEIESCGRQIVDLQTDIEEACHNDNRPLPDTRELNVQVQELRQNWVSIQSLSSIFMKKLRNVQNILTTVKIVENILKPIQKILSENTDENSMAENQNSGSMKRLREILISLQQTQQAQEDSIKDLKKLSKENNEICENLTRHTRKIDPDLDKNRKSVNNLIEKWDKISRNLGWKISELDRNIPAAENLEETSGRIKTASASLISTTRRVDQVENSLQQRINTRLPEDTSAIEIVEQAIRGIETEYQQCIKLLSDLENSQLQEMSSKNHKNPTHNSQSQTDLLTLQQNFDKLFSRCNKGVTVAGLYLRKLSHLSSTVKSLDISIKSLRDCENTLNEFDSGILCSEQGKEALKAYNKALESLLVNQEYFSQMLHHSEAVGQLAVEMSISSNSDHQNLQNINITDHSKNDPDKLVWSDKVKSTKLRWEQTLSDLKIRIEEIKQLLPKLEYEENNKLEAENLLNRIVDFLRELAPIESQQKYELQSSHNDNQNLLNQALEKQKDVVHRICEQVEPRFRNLSENVEEFLARLESDDQAQSHSNQSNKGYQLKLNAAFEQLKSEWSGIWTLTSLTINKLKSLISLSEQLAIAKKIIEEFRNDMSNIRYTSIKDDETLAKQIVILEKLALSIPMKDPEFELLDERKNLLKKSLEIVPDSLNQQSRGLSTHSFSSQSSIDSGLLYSCIGAGLGYPISSSRYPNQTDLEQRFRAIISDDRDLQQFSRACDEIIHRWNEIKTSVDRGLLQLSDRKEFNERLKFERGCNEISNVLRRWLNQVDTLINTIKQRSAGPAACQESEMNIQRRENQNIAERLDDIYPQIEKVIAEAAVFIENQQTQGKNQNQQISPNLTKNLTEISKTKELLKNNGAKLKEIWKFYQKKTDLLDQILQKMKITSRIVSNYEHELVQMSHLPQNIDTLRKIMSIIEKMQSDVPAHDPEFIKMESLFNESSLEIEVINRNLGFDNNAKTNSNADSNFQTMNNLGSTNQSVNIYKNQISLLKNRWNNVKTQLSSRLQIIYEQISVLTDINMELSIHNKWIANTEENTINNFSGPKNVQGSSETLSRQIQEYIDLLSNIENQQLIKLSKVEQKFQSNMNQAMRYKEQNSKFASSCKIIEKRSTILSESLDLELSKVRQRYERCGRLVRERVERLKVVLDQVRRKEVSE